jgi:hypothetical protein
MYGKRIQVGVNIPSCTQEEVLFTCAPECYAALVFCEIMNHDQVIMIRNLKRYCKYSGYLDSFQFEGFYPINHTFSAICMDAVYMDHYHPQSILHDFNKAYLGFSQTNGEYISTGHWECGEFGGDRTFKFLLQICAASASGAKLRYSTFHNDSLKAEFHHLLEQIVSKECTVGSLLSILFKHCAHTGKTVSEYVALELATGMSNA